MVTPADIKYLEPEIIETYQTIHACPELGFEEYKTSALVAHKLREYGLEVTEGVAMTGVVGLLDSGKPGKTLLLRADMDALPVTEPEGLPFISQNVGKMHACGHDGHVAMLLGAARYLSEHREQLRGRIKFCFQPAEENSSDEKKKEAAAFEYTGVGGAGLMVHQGAADDVDGCYALHVSPRHNTGTICISRRGAMASSDKFTATIIGTGGHGAMPHQSVDPVSAAASVLLAYNLLPAREVNAAHPCVVSVGTITTPSSAWNILPEKVEIVGNIRTFDEELRLFLLKRLEELLAGISASYRCTYTFDRMVGYNPTINDPEMSARAANVARTFLPEEQVILQDEPSMSSEDVGNFFRKAPGVFIWLGVCPPGQKAGVDLHSSQFRLDPNALVLGSTMHVNLCLDFLCRED